MSTVVFAGDSVTQGCFVFDPAAGTCTTGLSDGQKFSTLIGQARGFDTIINAGRSGDTVAALQVRLSSDVLSHTPDAVAIMIGINDVDATSRTPVATYKATLSAIVSSVKTAGARPTILMPNLVRASGTGQAFPAYLDAMSQVALEQAIPIVPIYDLFCRQWLAVSAQSQFDALFYDYKHPSAAGHAFIAQCVLQEQYSAACA